MTIKELMNAIYKDNSIHLDFVEDIAGGDCDCNIHQVLNTIDAYAREKADK